MRKSTKWFLAALATVSATGFASDANHSVPFTLEAGRLIVVKGAINDLDGLNVVIDSGADSVVVSPEVAAKLRLKDESKRVLTDGGKVIVETVTLAGLNMGAMRFENVSAQVAELSHSGMDVGLRIDALVGRDFMKRNGLSVDHEARRILFERATSRGPEDGADVPSPLDAPEKESHGTPAPDATPRFRPAHKIQVEAAIELAHRRFHHKKERIHELIGAALGPAASRDVLDYFLASYDSLLADLSPEATLFDGRSQFFLAQEGRTVRQSLERVPDCAAVVVEIELGRFVIFLGSAFFGIEPDRQADVLLHETLHRLGAGFLDSTFTDYLRTRNCYDSDLSPSTNLQRFVEGRCRR